MYLFVNYYFFFTVSLLYPINDFLVLDTILYEHRYKSSSCMKINISTYNPLKNTTVRQLLKSQSRSNSSGMASGLERWEGRAAVPPFICITLECSAEPSICLLSDSVLKNSTAVSC